MGEWLADTLPKILEQADPARIRLRPVRPLSDTFFAGLNCGSPGLRVGQMADGELEIMPPVGGVVGYCNSELASQVSEWAKHNGTGCGFGSSTGFALRNGAIRSPDVSWVRRERLAALTAAQKKKFLPLCPDFVVERSSTTDSLTDLETKMAEYIENGAVLGWLIDPENRRVRVYRPGQVMETLDNPVTLSGDPELTGFTLDLMEIWEPDL
jgi:Uma2 family endonuclease